MTSFEALFYFFLYCYALLGALFILRKSHHIFQTSNSNPNEIIRIGLEEDIFFTFDSYLRILE